MTLLSFSPSFCKYLKFLAVNIILFWILCFTGCLGHSTFDGNKKTSTMIGLSPSSRSSLESECSTGFAADKIAGPPYTTQDDSLGRKETKVLSLSSCTRAEFSSFRGEVTVVTASTLDPGCFWQKRLVERTDRHSSRSMMQDYLTFRFNHILVEGVKTLHLDRLDFQRDMAKGLHPRPPIRPREGCPACRDSTIGLAFQLPLLPSRFNSTKSPFIPPTTSPPPLQQWKNLSLHFHRPPMLMIHLLPPRPLAAPAAPLPPHPPLINNMKMFSSY